MRPHLARSTIAELARRIEFCEQQKKKLVDFLQDLKDRWLAKEITFEDYERIINTPNEGKTVQEWFEFYDENIKDCKDRINNEKKNRFKDRIWMTFFVSVFVLIIASMFYVGPRLIGFVIQEKGELYSEDLNLKITSSTDYEWNIENFGKLQSVRISGSIEGEGSVKVYLENLLVLDSENIKEKKEKKIERGMPLTGRVIDGEESSDESKEEKKDEKEAEKEEKNAEKEEKRDDKEEKKEEPTEQDSQEAVFNDQEEPHKDEFITEESTSDETTEETPATETSSEEQLNEGGTTSEDQTNLPEDTTEEEIGGSSDQEKQETAIVKEFSSHCEETCDLLEYEFNKSSYTLRFKVTGAVLNLDEIIYRIISEIEEVEENVTEPFINETVEEPIEEENITEVIPEIPENITGEINITIPEINETNVTFENITELNVTNFTTLQFEAVIGQPVRWIKHIKLEKPEINISVELPKVARNVSVRKIEGNEKYELDIENLLVEEEGTTMPIEHTNLLTGFVISESSGQGWFSRLISRIRGGGLTGNVVYQSEDQEDSTELIIEEEIQEAEVEYYTPGPQSYEEKISSGKRIIISDPNELGLTNVKVFTSLPEMYSVGQESRIKVFWKEMEIFLEFEAFDTDDNGKLDYIEWITPHLSNQTFEIIFISKAEHLDKDRSFVEDVYDLVKERDYNYSEIPKKHYLRITFERNLTSENDISIYARSSSDSTVEVYEKNSNELLASFGVIRGDGEYRAFLTNLQSSQNTFDLKIIGGNVEFDYIVDPIQSTEVFYDGFEVNNFATVWTYNTGVYERQNAENNLDGGGTWSIQALSSASDALMIISLPKNISGYTYCNLTSRLLIESALDSGEYICMDYSYDNGTTWNRNTGADGIVGGLCQDGNVDTEDVFRTVSYGISNPGKNQTFKFRFRFSAGQPNENAHIDNVNLSCYKVDNIYPQFSNYADNNGTLNVSGIGYFNVTVLNTNGTVLLEINGVNITATNYSLNNYLVNYPLTHSGVYTYKWHSWGNGSLKNYNVSSSRNYTVNSNTAPTHNNPILNSTFGNNFTYENLTCYPQNTQDPENDTVKNIFTWYRNNTPLLALQMPFEGGSNSTWTRDYSGYSNNGIVSGPTWNKTGGYDGRGAYEFDGNNDLINITGGSSLNFPSSFSLHLRFKLRENFDSSSTKTQILIDKYASDTQNFMIALIGTDYAKAPPPDGSLGIKVEGPVSGNYDYFWTTRTNWTAGVWYDLTFSYNHDNASNSKLYIDCINEMDPGMEITGTPDLSFNANWHIGGYRGDGAQLSSPPYYFNGTISDVMFYNYNAPIEQFNVWCSNGSNLIVSQSTQYYENWTCAITPNDGYQDGIKKFSNNLTIVYADFTLPILYLNNPPNNAVDPDGKVYFNCTATNNALSNISLYLNGLMNQTITVNGTNYTANFTLSLSNGNYNWSCGARDSYNNFNQSIVRNLTVNTGAIPNYTSFDGITTNWTNVVDIANVCNGTAILENTTNGIIRWWGCVNASNANFDTNVNFSYNNLTLNFGLHNSFNSSAEITIKNLTWDATPLVYRDGILCIEPDCSNVSYNVTTGIAIFNVTHFTSYVTQGNSQLIIWDETDVNMPYANKTKYTNEQTKFFANYSKKTDGSPITTATCTINFTDMSGLMTYNATSTYYEYNRSFSINGTFDWNVTCSASGFQTIILNDTVLINSSVDNVYPIFSNYWDNNGTLNVSGVGYFSVHVENTNGTVYLEINNTNITALVGSRLVSITNTTGHNNKDNYGGNMDDLTSGSGMNRTNLNKPSTWTAVSDAYANEWQSGALLNASNSSNHKIGWVSFDFGEEVKSLDKIYLWNIREPTGQNRRVVNYSIYYSTSPSVSLPTAPTDTSTVDYNFSTAGWTKLNTNDLVLSQRGSIPDPANGVINLNNISARYIAIEILTNAGDTNRVGLAEVGITRNVYEANYTFTAPGTYLYKWHSWGNGFDENYNVSNERSYTVNANTAPTHNNPILNSTFGTNLTTENLTCYNQSTYDINGDFVKNIFTWYKNNTSIQVLNMPFEGGSNSTWTRDYSGYSLNGQVINAIWNATGGYDGRGAYEFDGSTTRINISETDILDFNQSYTIAVWIYTRDFGGGNDGRIIQKSDGATSGYIFQVENDTGEETFRIIHPGSDDTTFQNGLVHLNTWQHLVLTYDNPDLRLYINGILINETTSNPVLNSDNRDVFIGSRLNDANFNGTIDDIQIFNISLSTEQVFALYQNRTDLIVSQETSAGEIWQCEVTPNDRHDDGIIKQSNNITIIAVNVTNEPQIKYVSPITNINPTEASYTTVNFNVHISDLNGVDDLNDSSIRANFTRQGEVIRQNLSCAHVNDIDGTTANYTCSIDMWYFDGAGNWNVTVSGKDVGGLESSNSSTYFQYNQLKAFVSSPSALTWQEFTPGVNNLTSNNDPLLLNNTGNTNLTVQINATNLVGEQDGNYSLYAENFSVGISTGVGDPECGGTSLSRFEFVNITNSLLPRGNFSVGDGNTGQEELYICLKTAGEELIEQIYSTLAEGSWTIRIFLAALVVRSSKKKKRKKSPEEDRLVSMLGLVIEELKDKYSLNKSEMTELLVKEIRERYGISKKEVIELVGGKARDSLPATVFATELGGLEALCKYMKENFGMSYHEIAEELERDDRTIWTAYNKANEKQSKPLEIKETNTIIPLSIFKNRELTVLEALIVHLKEKGMKYSEIAKLLNREQRNIWTICSRAVKKLKKQ